MQLRPRAIPCLLLKGEGLVKTVRFKTPTYVGDPINAVKLFNDLEVDELILLDITATREGRAPDIDRVREIASEAFMPICYGGGVSTVDEARSLFRAGVEKVAITTSAVENPALIGEFAAEFGNQSIVVGLEVKRDWRGRQILTTRAGSRKTGIDPVTFAREVEAQGAGELLMNDVDRDGMREGYDEALIGSVSSAVDIPVIACGGAGTLPDLGRAIRAGASAAAAGSLFVFKGPHRAVLINYPKAEELEIELGAFS